MDPNIQPSTPQSFPQVTQPRKGFGLLLAVQIILIALLLIGFFTSNKPGPSSSLIDIISLASMIAIIPGVIVAFIGIKDAVVSLKNKLGNGTLLLITSIILLIVSVGHAMYLFGGLSTLFRMFRLM
jgi:hypothetical protein